MPPSPHDNKAQFDRLYEQISSEDLVETLAHIYLEEPTCDEEASARPSLFQRFKDHIAVIWKETQEQRKED